MVSQEDGWIAMREPNILQQYPEMYSLRFYFIIIIIIFEDLSYHIMYVYIMLYSWNKLYSTFNFVNMDVDKIVQYYCCQCIFLQNQTTLLPS